MIEFKKIVRFLLSGYFFERPSIIKSLKRPNDFVEGSKKYDIGRIAVYTVSTGNYDQLKNPSFIDDGFDYFAFVDKESSANSVWKIMHYGDGLNQLSNVELSRYIKTHPHVYFPDYEYSIYIDANIIIQKDLRPMIYKMIEEGKVIAMHRHNARNCAYKEGRIIWAQGRAKLKDIVRQLWHYRKEGFPKEFGLFENNVIIRKHHDINSISIMETWWNEILKRSKRDQLSFTYSLWKNGFNSDFVLSLGNCSRNSPYFLILDHKN